MSDVAAAVLRLRTRSRLRIRLGVTATLLALLVCSPYVASFAFSKLAQSERSHARYVESYRYSYYADLLSVHLISTAHERYDDAVVTNDYQTRANAQIPLSKDERLRRIDWCRGYLLRSAVSGYIEASYDVDDARIKRVICFDEVGLRDDAVRESRVMADASVRGDGLSDSCVGRGCFYFGLAKDAVLSRRYEFADLILSESSRMAFGNPENPTYPWKSFEWFRTSEHSSFFREAFASEPRVTSDGSRSPFFLYQCVKSGFASRSILI